VSSASCSRIGVGSCLHPAVDRGDVHARTLAAAYGSRTLLGDQPRCADDDDCGVLTSPQPNRISDVMTVRIKRVYDPPSRADGYRVLIDRLWPRGVSREKASIDEWARDLAPSEDLRRWFGHRPERFDEFKRRYIDELRGQADLISALRRRARTGTITIVYAAHDTDHSNAAVLGPIVRRGFPRKS
jgi:uncharacterized protein YeaO (DUF488 family)